MMDDVGMSFVQIAMGFWRASQPLAYLVKSAHVYAVRQSSPPGDLCSLCCGVQCVYRLLPPNYNFCHAEGHLIFAILKGCRLSNVVYY